MNDAQYWRKPLAERQFVASIREFAEVAGVSEGCVRKWKKRYGYKFPEPPTTKTAVQNFARNLPKDGKPRHVRLPEVVRMREQRPPVSYEKIAKKLNITRQSAYMMYHRHVHRERKKLEESKRGGATR